MGRVRALRWIVLFTLIALISVAGYIAAHDEGLFELGDGLGTPGSADIQGSAAQPGCDWDDLFDADPTPEEVDAAVAACGGIDGAFIADQISPGKQEDDTVFSGSSAKNDQLIAQWQWDTGSAPTKDDLSNIYTYAVLNDNQELIIYAGLERLKGRGDSHVDFEFNQTPVELDRDPPCGDDGTEGPGDGAPCEFEGEKAEGDLLIVMDFTKGGDLGLLEIRRWNGMAYEIVDSVGGEGCNADDTVCAFNNGQSIPGGAWPSFDSKGNVVSSLEKNAFTEVGVNVTALFGKTPCFVGLTAKSRSSSSFSSTLKDFAQTDFEICSFTIDKDGSTLNPDPVRSKVGDLYTWTYTLENTGGATLFLISVNDSFFGDITDDARSAALDKSAGGGVDGVLGSCDPLRPGTFCQFSKTASIPDGAEDPFDTNVSASYGDEPAAGGTDAILVTVSDDDLNSLELFQPSVDVEKTGDGISTPGNTVTYTIDITNTSSADSPDLVNGVVTDSLLGDLLDPANPAVVSSTCTDTLAVGATCTIMAEYLVQEGDPDPLINMVDVLYNPAGETPEVSFPNEIRDSASHETDLVHPSFSLEIDVEPDSAFPGDLVTYTYTVTNTGDVTINEISVFDTLLGDLSSLFPDSVEPGEIVTVVVTRAVLETDPDPLVSTTTATYSPEGLPANEVTVTTQIVIDVLVPCAKSPGFWKGGEGVPKWDDLATDTIAQGAGFETDTLFPWLDSSLAGSSYLDVLNLSAQGDVTRQLSFKYIAARLNEVAFGVPESTEILLDQIDLYFMANPVGSDPSGAAYDDGQSLLGQLNQYFSDVGEERCPPSSEF